MRAAVFPPLLLAASVCLQLCACRHLSQRWVVELRDESTSEAAEQLARRYGLINHGQVAGLQGVYELELPASALGVRNLSSLTAVLQGEEEVWSARQLEYLQRVKRSGVSFSSPTDPLWKQQWSLHNYGQTSGPKGLDINVVPAWIQGYTGRGVVVSIVDDGVESTHPDLDDNLDLLASLNTVDGGSDPSPSSDYDTHGTNCAGIIAMEKSNKHCGVGVAYHASLGGIRFDLDQVTDVLESRLLGYQNDYIAVYSNSWGPSDSGFAVGGPGTYTSTIIKQAATKGRGGLGNIFTFASGNGGSNGDSCAADGYVNSIYTIAVGSVDQEGKQAFYDEDCTAKIAVTYSFNSQTFHNMFSYQQLSSTEVGGECTDSFTGTSASAPLAAAVVALALEANPLLSWRDMQYLLVYTSDHTNLLSSGGWAINGAGLWVSHQFGFGAIDAEAMVTRAQHWSPVPEEQYCMVYPDTGGGSAVAGSPLTLTFKVNSGSCSIVDYLEHVVVTMTLSLTTDGYSSYGWQDYYQQPAVLSQQGPRRGDISVSMTSPSGTASLLLPRRPYDYVNNEGYYRWPFTSLHHWGESPQGKWQITVSYASSAGSVSLSSLLVTFYGLDSAPDAVHNIPINCSSQCSRGCAASGEQYCDACRSLRMPSSLACVSSCPSGQCVTSGYCVTCGSRRLPPLAISGIVLGCVGVVVLAATVISLVWWRLRAAQGYQTL